MLREQDKASLCLVQVGLQHVSTHVNVLFIYHCAKDATHFLYALKQMTIKDKSIRLELLKYPWLLMRFRLPVQSTFSTGNSDTIAEHSYWSNLGTVQTRYPLWLGAVKNAKLPDTSMHDRNLTNSKHINVSVKSFHMIIQSAYQTLWITSM